MSGGDPMVLPNRKIGEWLASLAEAGVEAIRLGTKELAFHPKRFDEAFLSMLDNFHQTYPDVGFRLMIHFNHPDEFLQKGLDGAYLTNPNGSLKFHEDTWRAMKALTSRGWIQIENQAPIIKGVNADPDALRVMQRALFRVGVGNHYFFCGRDIVAYRAFNVPIETVWQTLNESQKGLSGVETHARLSITHYKGKTEVAAVTNEPIPGIPGTENGVVIFKILRNALTPPTAARSASSVAIRTPSGSTTTKIASSSTRPDSTTTRGSTRKNGSRSGKPRGSRLLPIQALVVLGELQPEFGVDLGVGGAVAIDVLSQTTAPVRRFILLEILSEPVEDF